MPAVESSSRRGLASAVNWLMGRANARRSLAQSTREVVRPALVGVWKSENAGEYSVLMAQTAALSAQYRRDFLSLARKLFGRDCADQLNAMAECRGIGESGLARGEWGAMYVLERTNDFILLGAENESVIPRHGKPHLRYDEYLRLRNQAPLLILLVRHTRSLEADEAGKLERFVPVIRKQLAGWADVCLLDWLDHAATILEQAAGAAELAGWKPSTDPSEEIGLLIVAESH